MYYHIQAVKEEQRGRKNRDVANSANLWGIVSNQSAFKETPFPPHQSHRFLAEHMRYYGNRYSTRHNKFRDFNVLVITLTPLNFKENVIVS